MGQCISRVCRNRFISDENIELNVNKFQLICWDIDGIDVNDEEYIRLRVESVVKHITEANALIVFLQDVTQTSNSILHKSLPDYYFLSGKKFYNYYYTLTLIHKKYVRLVSNKIINFDHSIPTLNRGCNLLKTNVIISGVSLCLINTQLYLGKNGPYIRVQQLRKAFKEMSETENTSTVIFGGDLRLCCDSEVAKSGGIPDNVYDVWQKTGSREELKYTWDTVVNDNTKYHNSSQRYQYRYDRVYVRPSTGADVEAIDFDLLGRQRLQPDGCYPSDHWGLCVNFSINLINC